ncbi:Uncharacterised protein [Klebsiella pneumoniae]|uniref:hypothetical protein n=1 Tax=Klebsiella pneumoniae TaxID=573 RepID=UPI000F6CC481|nr:hypothetical protein [Klebsiella pneumoniae]VED93699.1 Uncharacterised protein [Klebsiella pneumoniae]
MAFDPPLGSTSPAVLLDNATRLDELVNGPAATVPDRAGQPLDSWRQIVTMMLAAVTDAQNSITAIGLPFNTLSDAQAAVAAGKIPEGSVTWVRATDSAALADEYKNINGVLTATGRRMPSQDAVDALSRQLLDSIVTGDVPGFWLALKDSAGWISWGVDDQGDLDPGLLTSGQTTFWREILKSCLPMMLDYGFRTPRDSISMCWIISDAICWEIPAAVLHLLTKSAFWI